MVLGCFVWLRQESNEPIGSLKRTEQVWKAMPFALAQAKIDSEDAKNIADKSTKITIFL